MTASLTCRGVHGPPAERFEQKVGQRLDQSLGVRDRRERRRTPRFEIQRELSSV
jgi:hypothetical protein